MTEGVLGMKGNLSFWKKIVFVLFLFNSLFFFGIDYSNIKPLSDFRIMGTIDLRQEKGFSSNVLYKTLNHEGGMKFRVLEVGDEDVCDNKKGRWFYILLTSPMWVDNGDWIEKYQKYWIFIDGDVKIYNF